MTRRHRRRLIAGSGVALAVLAVLAIGLAGWFAWLPGYRPALGSGEVYGVDVSNHQGDIDWDDVAADNISFAYVKASEGGDWVDPWFAANWEGAERAGLERGAYHFFTLCRPGAEQAANFLDLIVGDPGELPPAVDLEFSGNCSERPKGDALQRELARFIEMVEAAVGTGVVLYVGTEFDDVYGITDAFDRPVWQRRMILRPGNDWLVWQLSAWARVDGIDGGVDLNVMRRA